MKPFKHPGVFLFLVLLILIALYKVPSFETQGLKLGMEFENPRHVAEEGVVKPHQLTLVEFFAGY